jgi:RNA polymerase sigma factor (sigma-70 family)
VDDRDALEDRDALIAAHLPNDWRDREKLEGLRLALKNLPAEQYQAVHLAYYGGLSHQEIAETLKLPLGTVKTRIRLGLQKLRDAWNADE